MINKLLIKLWVFAVLMSLTSNFLEIILPKTHPILIVSILIIGLLPSLALSAFCIFGVFKNTFRLWERAYFEGKLRNIFNFLIVFSLAFLAILFLTLGAIANIYHELSIKPMTTERKA